MLTKLWRRMASRTHPTPPARKERKAACRLSLEPLETRCLLSGDVVIDWNEHLLQSMQTSQPPRVPLSRNMALVHVAMFDAVNAIERSYEPYAARVKASRGASPEAAAAQAAHDTLVALYPSRRAIFDAELAEDLAGIPRGRARQGVEIGAEVARQILELRANDGASAIVTYTPPNNDPGQWQPTPPDDSAATGAHVSLVTPFATESSSQFRPGPPPALSSPEYAAAFNEAKLVGAADAGTADRDGNGLPDRTPDQTLVAELWRSPVSNHQVWNRIAQDMAREQDTSLAVTARLFALLNMSLHDGLQTSFGTKFHYGLWRPVTAIRRAAEDGNPATEADPNWTTLHPSTPPYPTYSGNAATIGATCATVLAHVFGDDTAFQFDWGRQGPGFAGVTRSYDSFWAAADEQAVSRVYGGIHFSFDSDAGQQIGADVADYVMDNYLSLVDHGKGKDKGAGPSGTAALQRQGLSAAPLFVGLGLFSDGALTRATLGGQTPTVADRGSLVALTPGKDSEFTTAGDRVEGRTDLLTGHGPAIGHRRRFIADALFAAMDVDDELPWLGRRGLGRGRVMR